MKSLSKDVSPVGWYVGSYLLRFVEIGKAHNDDGNRRFLIWENTVLVKATSLGKAFDKVVKVATEAAEPYKGGPKAVNVQWKFEGVTDLLPVYEKIADGSEIMWSEYDQTLRKVRGRVGRFRMEFKKRKRAAGAV